MTDKDNNNKIKESVNYDDSIDAGNHLHPMNTEKIVVKIYKKYILRIMKKPN